MSEKSTSGLELLVLFHFHRLFWKHSLIIKSIIYRQIEHAFGLFTYVCSEKCQASLPSFNWQDFVYINVKWKMSVQLSIFVIGMVGDKSLVYKLRVMAAVELHLNATHAHILHWNHFMKTECLTYWYRQ